MKVLQRSNVMNFTFLFFLALTLALVFASLDGFIDVDSAFFLRYAKSFADGNLFKTVNYYNDSEMEFLGIIPMGHPLLLGILYKILPIDLAVLSKFFNFLMVILLFFSIKKYTSRPWLFLSVFLFGSQIYLFKKSLTDFPFLVLMTIFTIQFHKFITETSLKQAWKIGLFSGFLTFYRFIGLFSVLPLGLFFLYQLKEKKKIKDAFLALAISNLGIAAVFISNKLLCGYYTGTPRAGVFHLTWERIYTLSIEFFAFLTPGFPEMNFGSKGRAIISLYIIFLAVLPVVLYFIYKLKFKHLKSPCSFNMQNLSFAFFFVGGTYIIALFLLTFMGVAIILRYLHPAIALVFFGLIFKIESQGEERFSFFSQLVVVMALASFVFYGIGLPVQDLFGKYPGYFKYRKQILEKYSEVGKSIVFFGNRHLIYLRPEVQIEFRMTPGYNGPQINPKKFVDTINEIVPKVPVYIDWANYEKIPEVSKISIPLTEGELVKVYQPQI